MATNPKAEYLGDSQAGKTSQIQLRIVDGSSKKLAHYSDCRK